MWSPRSGLGAAAPEDRTGFGTQRRGFNPQICPFFSLCDQDSLVNLSEQLWFPYLKQWGMLTILHDGWGVDQIRSYLLT